MDVRGGSVLVDHAVHPHDVEADEVPLRAKEAMKENHVCCQGEAVDVRREREDVADPLQMVGVGVHLPRVDVGACPRMADEGNRLRMEDLSGVHHRMEVKPEELSSPSEA